MAKVIVSISFDSETIDLIDEVIPHNRSRCVNEIVKCCLQWCNAKVCLGHRGGIIAEHVKKISMVAR